MNLQEISKAMSDKTAAARTAAGTNAPAARTLRESSTEDVVVTSILRAKDAETKLGTQPRFGIIIKGIDQPIFGFKNAVKGILPDVIPAGGIHAQVTMTKNGEWWNLSSLAFKFVDDATQAKINALAGKGIAVNL